jgi:lipopolysaccharide/colanic/teichoic acid biosynthesis glycosyltransferase
VLEQATRPATDAPLPAMVSEPVSRAPYRPLHPLRGLAFVEHVSPASALESFVKRAVDLAVAMPALIVLGPLMLAVAIAIKLDSPGPVLIVQERVSRGLRKFRMYKFRSMVANADELMPSLQALNEATPPLFKIRNDPRITRIGRHLRRLSVDELPQLINVLRGEMSLVGPRPPFMHEVAQDRWRQTMRLRHAPGMTGLWQVSGRSDLSYEAMIALDLRYVREWSIGLDLSILLRTPTVVLKGKGAR